MGRLGETHARIAEYYLAEAARDGWQMVERYGRFHTPRHLLLSANPKAISQAADCLTDLTYLQAALGNQSARSRAE